MSEPITEAEETRRGKNLVSMLKLKEARNADGKRFDPPRYETSWGTKTALGLFRSVSSVICGND